MRAEADEDGALLNVPNDGLQVRQRGVLDRNQSIRIRVGERPQKNRVDYAEERRVRADAEGQGEDRDSREPRGMP